MRNELKLISRGTTSLRSWRRRLVLDPSLRPCRQSVISDPVTRMRAGGGWTQQKAALVPEATQLANKQLLDAFIQRLTFVADDSYQADSVSQQHLVARRVPLRDVADMLADYRLDDPRDIAAFTGLLASLGEAVLRDPGSVASVYQMRPRAISNRTVSEEGTLEDGFQQGPTRRSDGSYSYPGDNTFCAEDVLSLQIHKFDLNGPAVRVGAPLLAINVPPSLARNWLVQVQIGQS